MIRYNYYSFMIKNRIIYKPKVSKRSAVWTRVPQRATLTHPRRPGANFDAAPAPLTSGTSRSARLCAQCCLPAWIGVGEGQEKKRLAKSLQNSLRMPTSILQVLAAPQSLHTLPEVETSLSTLHNPVEPSRPKSAAGRKGASRRASNVCNRLPELNDVQK